MVSSKELSCPESSKPQNTCSVYFCKKRLWQFSFIAVLFIIVNLCFYAYSIPDKRFSNDSPGYIQPAKLLITELRYDSPLRLPVYPAFIAIAMKLTNHYDVAVIIAQIILLLCSGILAVLIGEYYLKKISPLLFALVLFNTSLIISPHRILPDTLFLFLFLSYCYFLIKSIQSNKLLNPVICGIFATLLSLTRGNGFYLSLITPVIILLCDYLRHRVIFTKRLILKPLLFFIVFLTTVSPWLLHNYKVNGRVGVNSQAYVDFAVHENLMRIEYLSHGVSKKQASDSIFKKALELEGMSFAGNMGLKREEKHRLVASHVKEIISMYPKKDIFVAGLKSMGFFYLDPSYKNFTGHLKIKSLHLDKSQLGNNLSLPLFFKALFSGSGLPFICYGSIVLFLVILRVLLVIGWILLVKQKKWSLAICCTIIISYFTLTSGLIGYARYRIPIEPILLILAVYGLSCLNDIWRKNGQQETL
ncbi:MAG: glycosyltransferase family 39 protein [Candidatus Omnitrophica bacterium]|nr:glycosyltransferase family 39 protein [Candidatus Omnitrophota bacterium]